ncbi:MAG: diguanylate cyclase [Calditrichaeota bacterium]|nr:MAG: diguanylate cyclase [Calditrichota bacterium]
MRILIVDDDRQNRHLIKTYLENAGFTHILEAPSAVDCFSMLKISSPILPEKEEVDLILLDLRMPEINGVEACKKIKSSPVYKDVPIIMVTASEEMDDLVDSFSAGATDYIRKPIQRVELIARVNAALRLKYEMDKRKQHERELLRIQEELRRVNQELLQLTVRDELTGVYNRRYFDEYIENEWSRVTREKMELSIIIMDIDFFKLYNDTYGHQAGDECLKKVAETMRQALKRPADRLIRYGGEEFVAVLPYTKKSGAQYLAEFILTQVAELKISHKASPILPYVTISAGVATYQPQEKSKIKSVKQLIEKADQALYRAKQQGRNCVVISD